MKFQGDAPRIKKYESWYFSVSTQSLAITKLHHFESSTDIGTWFFFFLLLIDNSVIGVDEKLFTPTIVYNWVLRNSNQVFSFTRIQRLTMANRREHGGLDTLFTFQFQETFLRGFLHVFLITIGSWHCEVHMQPARKFRLDRIGHGFGETKLQSTVKKNSSILHNLFLMIGNYCNFNYISRF